jgi:putative tricarboxylic transport membrane protein
MLSRLVCALALVVGGVAAAAVPGNAECIAGAKPGGGFDVTCKLAQAALQQTLRAPMRVSYLPGGIGAVAWQTVVAQRRDEGGTIVAFSTGSLLNLAIGRFGQTSVDDVRWLATVGADCGAIVVRSDAPYASLPALVAALKSKPEAIVFGGGGRIGSQDWMKSALVARAAGVGPKAMRYVAFEGGGEAMAALGGGHVQVYAGDASEMAPHLRSGAVRLLAVLAPQRLPGTLAHVPTAREQGLPIEWTTVRGFYMGPKVAPADYEAWRATFDTLLKTPQFARLRDESGLLPFSLTGDALAAHARQEVARLATLAREFGVAAR